MQAQSRKPKDQHSASPAARLWRDQRGVTAITTAFGAIILMGFSALAIDVTIWHVNQRKMQGAADQAVVAAGLAGDLGNSMTVEAQAIAASFGLVNGQNGVTVTVNNPPSQGSYKSDSNAVEVVISQVQPQYLSKMLLSVAPTETVRAVALYGNNSSNGTTGPTGAMCIMALDSNPGKLSVETLDLDGHADVVAPDCDVYNNSPNSDGTDVTGSGTLSVRSLYLHGNYATGGSGSLSYTGKFVSYGPIMPDPYAGVITIPSYSGCTKSNYSLGSNSSDTLSPGVYCGGMTIKGNLTLNAGTYIIDGGSLSVNAQATITGTAGVTIILTSSSKSNYGTVTINGGATVNLTAPGSGAKDDIATGVPGIALWIDGNAPEATDTFNGGSTQVVNGAIYMPSQDANFVGGSSSGTQCSQLIAFTITFSGNANFKHSCSGVGVIDPPAMPKLAS